jgi:hypothetical protein
MIGDVVVRHDVSGNKKAGAFAGNDLVLIRLCEEPAERRAAPAGQNLLSGTAASGQLDAHGDDGRFDAVDQGSETG